MKEKRLKKQIKKFVSEFLALAMVMGMWQMPVYAGTEGAGVAPLAVTSPGEATPGETTLGEAIPDGYEEILLNGDDTGASAMNMDKTFTSNEYAYLGYVTTKGAAADCRYLQFTYEGNISALRLEIGGKFYWMNKNQEDHFVTKDGSDIPLIADKPTTVTIDLEKSGVALADFHMHNGDTALEQNSKITITNAKLLKPVVYEEILLNGDDTGASAMNMDKTFTSNEYAYLGYVTTKGAAADCRYLQFTYEGNISALRLEIGGKFYWMNKNQEDHFVTKDGSDIPLIADKPTTVTIDLKKSGVKVSDFHMHNGDASLPQNSKIKITDAKLIYLLDAVESAAAPEITSNPISNTYALNAKASKLTVSAKSVDGGELSYQWYSNTTNSIEGATKIEGANGAGYTPATNVLGVTYYYCEVANTNEKATVNKTTVANTAIATIEVTNNAGNQYGGLTEKIVDEIILDGNDKGESSMIGDYGNVGVQYKYLGYVTTKDATSAYKYLLLSYVGDIKYLRMEFNWPDDSNDGPYWFDAEQDTKFVSAVVDGFTLVSEDGKSATVVIDLEKSGLKIGNYCGIHMHYGDESIKDSEKTLQITDARLLKPEGASELPPEQIIKDAAKPSITANPAGASYTYKAAAKALAVTAASTDNGVLSYQWYSNTKDSVGGATPIANATGAGYTPDTTKVGTTYYFCKVTNTNEKATVTKTAAAYSKTAKIVVTQAANKITGVANSYTKGIKDKAFTLKAKGQGKISYKTSNKKVATVTSKGKVTVKGYGKATITITAAGNAGYTRVTKKVTIVVAPKTALSKVKAQKKALKVTWKKDKAATGYKIQYTTDKNFKKSVKTITVKKASATSYTIRKLAGNKKYYVRVSAYKKVGRTTVNSRWSKAKNAKTKK